MSLSIVSVGGGPAGLYFSILMKKAFPETRLRVLERNRADDTFGWGVVFSDETLGNFAEADPESMAEIKRNFASWTDIETWFKGTMTRSTGHGFCGLARRKLLGILHDRCRALGVELDFEHEVTDLDELRGADLVLAADGVHSRIRERFAAHFEPTIDWRRAKFCWLGTTKPLRAFTFVFKESEHGLFQVHAYPYEEGLSTWIVECREDAWKRAGLDAASEAETVAYCEALFAEELGGHRLLTNKSIWRTFPTIKNARWSHENFVLVGDAAHTAHFSIGSGTKLAMEDAIALTAAFRAHGTQDIPRVLRAYEESRKIDVLKTQKAAQTSLEWFENSRRYLVQHPLQLKFNLMTRSKRITYDNLRLRDPQLVDDVAAWFQMDQGRPPRRHGKIVPPVFTPFRMRELTLENRIVVSPMCQYSAQNGTPDDWHLVHLGSRGIGGAGLVITEMTNVSADGRITPGCAGMYQDEHTAAWKRIVDFVHARSAAKIGIQLAHAGRKGSARHPWEGADVPIAPEDGGWPLIAPSAIAFAPGWPVPKAMDDADLERVRADFVRAAERSLAAGFDFIELHMAHGYLLSTFISPLSNRRQDDYGGSLDARMRFPLEVFDAVRAVWPAGRPLGVRISASDWVEDGGVTGDDAVLIAKLLKAHGCDVIDVSTGGIVYDARPEYGRMYQVPFAEQVRYEAQIPVMAVGAIQNADHANTVLAAGRADLCCLARPHLADPYLTLHAAEAYGYADQPWPGQYLPGRKLAP
jgi:anthraniloyl-CoA monooxygenase